MTLLARYREQRAAADEALRGRHRDALRQALRRHLPGVPVWVYGSLCRPGKYGRWSDIDLAVERLPAACSLGYLQSLLSGATGTEVDICLLAETRLADVIRRTGERWTP